MSRYRFAICYENMVLDGWITEKLFDCLTAGVVPIYLGAPDIADVVDPACYIDVRRFGAYEEMDRYLEFVDRRRLRALPRRRSRLSASSEQFRQFSPDAFADGSSVTSRHTCASADSAHLWR